MMPSAPQRSSAVPLSIEDSSPEWLGVLRSMFVAIGAIMLGLGVGKLVAWDTAHTSLHPLGSLLRDAIVPLGGIWTLTAILPLLALVVLIRSSGLLFKYRYETIIALLFASGSVTGVNLSSLDAFELTFIGIGLFWLAASFIEHRPVVAPPTLLILLAGLTITTLFSVSTGRATSLFSQHTILSKLALVFVLVSIVHNRRLLRIATRTLVIAAAISAAIAIATVILYKMTGIVITFDDLEEFHYKDTPLGRMLRATAFRASPQSLGHLLILALALTMCSDMKRWLLWPVVGLLLAGCLSTFSMGTILTSGVVFGLGFFFRWPNASLHFLTAGAAGLVIGYVTGLFDIAYDKIIVPIGQSGLEDRINYIQVGVQALDRHPLVGMGLKNFSRLYELPIHNSYLQFAAETGMISMALFIALILYALHCAIAGVVRASDASEVRLFRGIILGLIGMSVHFMLEPLYSDVVPWSFIALAICAGMLYRTPNTIRSSS